MNERTLMIIKPDAVQRKLIGKIIQQVENAGYKIVNIHMVQFERHEAETFYEIHRGKEFFEPLISFMISGPCVPMVIEGENAVEGLRRLVGATNPKDAAEGTIRKLYATDGRHNAVHASDSQETALREISFFFDAEPFLDKQNVEPA